MACTSRQIQVIRSASSSSTAGTRLSEGGAALVVAAAQVLAVGARIGTGRWSDVVGSRIGPLRKVGVVVAGCLAVVAALAGGPLWLLLPALAVAGGLSMGWNALAFAAAAELAGAARSGAVIGFQQSVLSAIGIVLSIVLALSGAADVLVARVPAGCTRISRRAVVIVFCYAMTTRLLRVTIFEQLDRGHADRRGPGSGLPLFLRLAEGTRCIASRRPGSRRRGSRSRRIVVRAP